MGSVVVPLAALVILTINKSPYRNHGICIMPYELAALPFLLTIYSLKLAESGPGRNPQLVTGNYKLAT